MSEFDKVGDIFTPNKHNISTVIKKVLEIEKKLKFVNAYDLHKRISNLEKKMEEIKENARK